MKFRLKRLMLTGAIALLIAFVLSGTSLSRHASIVSLNHFNGQNWLGAPVAFPGVVFAQSQTRTASKEVMSEQAFKNIQILKGIPVDEFMGTMGLFSAALSVCCGDCHVGAGGSNPQWDADPPRKRVARKMIAMVRTINKDNFGGREQVTCWTCHRGSQSPAVTPTIDTIYNPSPVFVPPDILPAAARSSGALPAGEVLDKYIQALGGADKLARLTSYTAKGTSGLFGEDSKDPAEIYAKAPNQLSILVHEREGDLARVYDGSNAWVMLPLTVVGEYPLNASAKEGARLDAALAFPGTLKQFFTNWRSTYPANVNGRDVYVLQGSNANGLLATFYFDKQTGLLDRAIHYANSAVGRVPTQIDYSDYRSVDGIMMPFHFTYGWVSGREDYQLSEVQPNVSIDPAKFAEPKQRPKKP